MSICNNCRRSVCKCGDMRRKKTCSVCGKKKWLVDFAKTGVKDAPETKRRSYCKTCKHKKNPASWSRRILDRIRWHAKRRGLSCELTAADVRALRGPCTYCSSEHKPSIDRSHPAIGYLRENCVAACFRCNSLKGDMPLAAWLVLVPAVKYAEEHGLFGEWRGSSFPHR